MNKLQYLIIAILVVVVIALGIVIAVVPDSNNSIYNNITATPGPESTQVSGDASPSGGATEAPSTSSPGKPLEGLVICIDPGHQGQGNKEKEACAPWTAEQNSEYNNTTMKAKCTSGTSGKFSGVDEYIVTLQMALKMRTTLEALGATVVLTRDTHDIDISNQDRAKIGNDAKADVVLRIHCNGSDNQSVEGVELWVRDKGDNTAEYKERAAYDEALGKELLDYLAEETGAKKRAVNRSDAYTGINWSEVPCIIIETGFMSNEKEDKLLVTDEYQQKFADAVGKWLQNSTLIKGEN